MSFAPKLGASDRAIIERALTTALAPGEQGVFGVTCTHLRRAQQFLVVTDRRLLGVAVDGRIRRDLPLPTAHGYHFNDFGTLIIKIPAGEEKIGLVGSRDIPRLRAALDALLGDRSPSTQTPGLDSAPQAASTPHGRLDVQATGAIPPTTGPTLVEQLAQLTALRDRGALDGEQFEAAKAALLGTTPRRPVAAAPPEPSASSGRNRRKKVSEAERTCERDGTVWFVPLELTKVRKPARFGLGLVELGDVMLGGGGAASQQLTREEAAWARAQAARRCPQCGSQAYSERVVRH